MSAARLSPARCALAVRFFWRACGVCAYSGFVSVAWSCDPTFIAYPHVLPIVRYPYCFFRHVWYWVLCFSCSVCADCADGSGAGAGSCRCLAQCCRGGGFFPNSAFLALVLGFFWSCIGISRLRLNALAALVVLPFGSVCLSYASTAAYGCWPCGFSLRTSLLVVPACVCRSFLGRRSCLLSLLLLGAG